MGNLVFQATLGGQVNLVGPNTASTFNINVPAIAGTLVTTGDTGTVTNTMLASSAYTAPGTIGSGTPNTGAFTTLSATGNVTLGDASTDTLNVGNGGLVKDASGNVGIGVSPSAWVSPALSVLEFPNGNNLYGSSASVFQMNANNYYDGTTKYKVDGFASRYRQDNGKHLWYYAASGTAGATCTLTQAMTLDASGNLGVGTTSPSQRLQVYNNVNGTSFAWGNAARTGYLYQDSDGVGITNASGTGFDEGVYLNTGSSYVGIYTNGAEKARIDSSGRFLIGTTTAQGGLTTQCAIADQWATFNINTSQFGVGSYTRGGGNSAAYPIAVWATYDGTQKASIDGSGNLLVGTTSGNSRLVVNGSTSAASFTGDDLNHYQATFNAKSASASTHYQIGFFKSTGSAVGAITHNDTTTTYATSSDYRLKEVSGTLSGYKERLLSLQPKQGTWKENGAEFRGFLAHEFAESYPSSVTGEKDAVDTEGNPRYQGMQAGSSEVIADLVAYIKELETRLSALEA